MKNLCGAIVGCGTIARNAHLPSYKHIKGAEIIAAVDTSKKRAKRLSEEFHIDSVYTDYTQLLDRSDIDFVDITVPPKYHTQIAIDMMRAGKHVIIEKPMAISVADAQLIVDAARVSGVKAGVVHNRRFYPVIQNAKRRIESGALGEVYQAIFKSLISGPSIGYPASSWHFDKEISGGGVVMDQGTHTVDLIRWLVGEVNAVFALVPRIFPDLDVGLSAILETKNNTNCTMELSWINDFTVCPITLWGSAGSLFIEPMFGYIEEVHGPRNSVKRWLNMSRTLLRFANQFASTEPDPLHLGVISNFLVSIARDCNPEVDVYDGLKSIEIIEALYAAARRIEWTKV